MQAAVLLLAVLGLGAELSIDGPAEPIQPREYCQLTVRGLDDAALPEAYAGRFPREGTQFVAARTWGGAPFLWFSASQPGRYLVEVVDFDGRRRAEAIVVVGGEPEPEPEPAPDPPVVDKLFALIVYEAQHRDEQYPWAAVLMDPGLSRLAEPDDYQLLKIERDTDDAGLTRWVKRAGELPYLFLSAQDGTILHEGRLPTDAGKIRQLIRRHLPPGATLLERPQPQVQSPCFGKRCFRWR